MFGLSLWGAWAWWRGRLAVDRVASNRWLLRASVVATFLPFLSVWVGWWTREVGRQPWVVYGLMRTADGVSPMATWQELFWLACYMTFELTVWGATWWFLSKVVRNGPDMTSPMPGEGDEKLGAMEPAAPRFKHQGGTALNPT
jgi:cytochrome d ubiquinol oxidase subunit I